MDIIQIPSKTYKLNNDVIVRETELGEPTAIDNQTLITINDSLNGYPLSIDKLYGDTEQDGTPTPEEAVSIKVVTGDVSVVINNGNLLKLQSRTSPAGGLTCTYNQDGSFSVTGTATSSANIDITHAIANPLPAGIYTFSIQNVLPRTIYIHFYTAVGGSINAVIPTGSTSIMVELPKTTGYSIRFNTVSGTTYNELIYMKLEVGSHVTNFTVINSQSQLLSLGNIELCKIRDYEQYIWQEKTSGKWYKHKATGKLVLDGSENWGYNTNGKYFYVNNAVHNVVNWGGNPSTNGFCNRYKCASGWYVKNQQFDYGIGIADGNQISVRNINYTDLVAFKADVTNNNIIIYYQIKTSTDEEITDTTLLAQLNSLLGMKTYKNITNIYTTTNNLEPALKINYYTKDNIEVKSEIVDTIDGYVDNKEAMKQAIYHILRTERYDYIIYSDNYGVELRQYIGESFAYLKNTIEQTLRDALTYDLRIKDIIVTEVTQSDKDKALVKFIAYTIYGDLQLEVNVVV